MSENTWRVICQASALKREWTRMDAVSVIADWRLRAIPMEPTRIPGTPDPAGFIGPALDGTELEVFADILPEKREISVFHMMPARPHVIQKIRKAKNKQERKQR
ncbi:hypothetical protein [Microbacterium album]|uniref:hypothetical protein n=1 Tax=Microbacterium album TaxID=2053191 RepID=UPI00166C6EA2|nr:hypothetical protein [Microbacterium album]